MFRNKFNLRKVVAIAICLAGTTFFSGCDKEKEGGFSTQSAEVSVVVSELRNDEYFITSWINDTKKLDFSIGKSNPIYYNPLFSAFVDNEKNVYVAGTNFIAEWPYNDGAKLWKNGNVLLEIDGAIDYAPNAVFVSNSKVYVAGRQGNVATLWEMNESKSLTDKDNGTYSSNARTVFVSSDNSVYAAGEIGLNKSEQQRIIHNERYYQEIVNGGIFLNIRNWGIVWKNYNEYFRLTDGIDKIIEDGIEDSIEGIIAYSKHTGRGYENDISIYPLSIYVRNGRTYVAAEVFFGANTCGSGLWRDNELVYFRKEASFRSIYVTSNDEVHIVGKDNSQRAIAIRWRNGNELSYRQLTGEGFKNDARFVTVSGSTVYVAGTELVDDKPTATLWENGNPKRLQVNTNSSSSCAIFVNVK